MSSEAVMWIVFGLTVGIMLWLDLFVLQRKAHAVSMRESVFWSIVWVVIALAFGAGVWAMEGGTRGQQFLAAYLIERSLSIDNLFVFILLFQYFRVPVAYQQKTLMIGILGALVMRAIFIAFGLALLKLFHPIIYIFGALLIYTAYKMIAEKDKEVEPNKNPVIKLFRRIMPVTGDYHAERFFVKNEDPKLVDKRGNPVKRMATPLVLVLLAITMFDLVFAIDSIPAVLAVSDVPFIVYTSNVFAVLGLRSMYFALAGFVGMFRYLSYGLAVILAFIGVKLLISDLFHFPIAYALGVVVAVLAASVLASVIIPDKGGKGHGHSAPETASAKVEPPAH